MTKKTKTSSGVESEEALTKDAEKTKTTAEDKDASSESDAGKDKNDSDKDDLGDKNDANNSQSSDVIDSSIAEEHGPEVPTESTSVSTSGKLYLLLQKFIVPFI